MSPPRQGIAILCDADGHVLRWLRDDLSLSSQAPVGSSWQGLLDRGSVSKAVAFMNTAREQGAALDWLMYVSVNQSPSALRFTAAMADNTLTLLACVPVDTPTQLRRGNDTESCGDLTRLNNDLVNTQRTLTRKNTELKRMNDELNVIRNTLEQSQADLLTANRRLLAQANRDGLTGVYNRRALQARLNEEVERAERYGQPLSLAMIDVDYFKQYNDTLGHLAGDDALRTVASALQSTVRACDFVARYGGEEFAVILPNILGDAAEQACERLRRAVADINNVPQPITISVGLASHGPLTPTADDLVKRADQALYNAKQTGRNRVITAWQLPCS
ncbi:GGDEF domain-containing protein [Phycisphaerales bacterium AB-hyl4]|uniref:diguanylate cyclase n=1 Tax=Natronomicrosphaera hydrolytica TaxID=3242702 RepID=A0ABV4U4D9_9BACT